MFSISEHRRITELNNKFVPTLSSQTFLFLGSKFSIQNLCYSFGSLNWILKSSLSVFDSLFFLRIDPSFTPRRALILTLGFGIFHNYEIFLISS